MKNNINMVNLRTEKNGFFLLLIILILDQATKIFIQSTIPYHQAVEIIGNVVRVTFVTNPVGAFSTKLGGNYFYITVASIAGLIIIAYIIFNRGRNKILQLSLFIVLAGAIGNLIDRIRVGEVIDWIDIGIGNTRWPTFNVADSAIVVGMVLLIFFGTTNESKEKDNQSGESDTSDSSGHLSGEQRSGTEPLPNSETDSHQEDLGNR